MNKEIGHNPAGVTVRKLATQFEAMRRVPDAAIIVGDHTINVKQYVSSCEMRLAVEEYVLMLTVEDEVAHLLVDSMSALVYIALKYFTDVRVEEYRRTDWEDLWLLAQHSDLLEEIALNSNGYFSEFSTHAKAALRQEMNKRSNK